MGVKFFESLHGRKFYVCRTCSVYLTNKDLLISTRFTSANGPALLFHEVTNVVHGDREQRHLMTGSHRVRDAFCKGCASKVGWFYEHAASASQRYKEGKTILEEARICERIDHFAD